MQVVNGFRQRGEAMTRLETFTDAALWSFALVFVVLVFIYPLKALYSGAFHGFSDGYFETISTLRHWFINMVVPGVSIVLALNLPDEWIGIAGWVYGSFGILLPWYGIRRARGRPAT